MSRLKLCSPAVIGLFLSALLLQRADSATYRRFSLDDLAQSSEIIIYGRVIDSHAQWDPATCSIWTQTEFLVLDGPKGKAGPTVSITEPGGVLGDKGQLYPGVPQFRRNQEVVLFLYRAPGSRLRITGLLQGVYPVSTDPKTGERMVAPAVPQGELIHEERSRQALPRGKSVSGSEKLSRFLDSMRRKAGNR